MSARISFAIKEQGPTLSLIFMDAKEISSTIVQPMSDERWKRLIKLVYEELQVAKQVSVHVRKEKQASIPIQPTSRQTSMSAFVQVVNIPCARSAREAWDQWFYGDPDKGLIQPLKTFTPDMVRVDRKKFSERRTLGTAFSQYNRYQDFAAAYPNSIHSFSSILKEVRRRKKVI